MIMIRRASVLLPFLFLSLFLFAQETPKPRRIARPDIPGSFIFEFGFNRALNSPTNFTQGFWGSRTVNLYYQYHIQILKSNFSFVPAIGFSLERFKLTNNYTLNPVKDPDGSYSLLSANLIRPGTFKSMIIADYFEVPLAFRFDTHPEDMSRSFNITIGGRAGVLVEGLTKIKYKEDGESKIFKDKQNHGLNQYRYSLFSRIGVGGFHFFTYYNFSPLFEKNKGPQLTAMNTFTVGISINGF
jgi:hypothetical protein